MSTNRNTGTAGTPDPGDDRTAKWIRRALYTVVTGAFVLNPSVRRVLARGLRGMRFGGAIAYGRLGEAIAQAIGHGYFLLEVKWVVLVLLKMLLDWKLPHWGAAHVLVIFGYGLLIKHFEKAYMVQRLQEAAAIGGAVGFMRKINPRDPLGSLGDALKSMGTTMSVAAWEVIRKVQNEGHYFTWGLIITAFMPAGDTGLWWVIDPLASLSSLILWEISSATGNNKSIDGAQVVTAQEYDVMRWIEDEKGKITFELGKGRKAELPWFQSVSQRGFASAIAMCVLVSWGIWIVYLGDYDHDGVKSVVESSVYKTKTDVPDSDQDGYSDGWEVRNRTNPLVKADVDPLASRYQNREFWAMKMREEIRIKQDSIRVARRIAAAEHKAFVDSVEFLRKMQEDSLKTSAAVVPPDRSDLIGKAAESAWVYKTAAETRARWWSQSEAGATSYILIVGGLIAVMALVLVAAAGSIGSGTAALAAVMGMLLLYYPIVLLFNHSIGSTWGGLDAIGYWVMGGMYVFGLIIALIRRTAMRPATAH